MHDNTSVLCVRERVCVSAGYSQTISGKEAFERTRGLRSGAPNPATGVVYPRRFSINSLGTSNTQSDRGAKWADKKIYELQKKIHVNIN